MTRRAVPVVLAVVLACLVPGRAAALGPLAAPNPFLGPTGTATMHGDAGSSDATPTPGPGIGEVAAHGEVLGAACPTLLQGGDGLVLALCTSIADRVPAAFLLDPHAGRPLAQLPLSRGTLLGGVYAYLDERDRLVAVDGARLVRLAHEPAADGWRFRVDSAVDLPASDGVTGLSPGWDGTVWFATVGGTVGAVAPDGTARTFRLPAGEGVYNSISTAPSGRTAVVSTHAVYEFEADADGVRPVWRAAYDRGPARKPGQLSWGSGSTPTYFGPVTGAEYIVLVDNADPVVDALVLRSGSGAAVCRVPLPTVRGSENSPVAVGGSAFVASTYGYPYPTLPDGAGPALPPAAPFLGGVTRIDVDGCRVVWDAPVRSAAVPRLSLADDLLYTTTRIGPATPGPLDGFALTVLDPATGAVVSSRPLPGTLANDTLQMAPLLTADGAMLQGTVTGLLRINDAA